MSNIDSRGKFFRESFKGFNKEDVISFIDRMNKEHNSVEEAFQRQVKNLKQDLIKSSEVNQLLASELENNNAIIRDLKNQINEQTENISRISDEEISERQELEKIKCENEELKQQISQINLNNDNSNNVNIDKNLKDFIDNSLNKFTDDEREKLELKYIIRKFEEKSGLKVSDVYSNDISQSMDFEKQVYAVKEFDAQKQTIKEFDEEKEKEIYEPLIAELERKNDLLKEEMEKLQKANKDFKETITNLKSNIENKCIQIDIDGDADETIKVKAYETIMSGLGKIILSTEKEADDILTKAITEAEEITSKANVDAENTIMQAKTTSDKIIYETELKYKSIIKKNEEIIAKIRVKHDKLLLEYSLMKDKFESSYSDFYASLGKFENNIKEWESNLNEGEQAHHKTDGI